MTTPILTREEFTAHVGLAIEKALRHESYIDAEILSLTGFSTGVQRRLVSNLCHLPKENPVYLEIGLYAGATFAAAINNNPTLRAIGVEDFSQPFGRDGIREELLANVAHQRSPNTILIDRDCFSIPPESIAGPVDIYFYDGEHGVESQSRALPHFIDAMAERFLFMVDDANWQTVRDGTAAGFAALKDRVEIENRWMLVGEKAQDDPVWWNGVALYLCRKL